MFQMKVIHIFELSFDPFEQPFLDLCLVTASPMNLSYGDDS